MVKGLLLLSMYSNFSCQNTLMMKIEFLYSLISTELVVADFCGILKCKLQDPAVNKFTQSILKFVSLANDITNGYFYSFYILRFIIAKYNISYT